MIDLSMILGILPLWIGSSIHECSMILPRCAGSPRILRGSDQGKVNEDGGLNKQ